MSEEQDQSQKTEQPSQRRLDKAREEGQVFSSKELNTFLSLFTLACLTIFLGGFYFQELIVKLRPYLAEPHKMVGMSFAEISRDLGYKVLPFLVIPSLIMLLVNLGTSLAQQGIIFSFELIKPKLSRISIFAGFKRLFSINSVVELLKGLVKMFLLGFIIFSAIKGLIRPLVHSYNLSIFGGLMLFKQALLKIFVGVCSFLFLLAVFDYFYQKFSFLNRMKMTKKEVKDEHKEQEGSPEVKSKLRSMRLAMSKRRISAAVPKADFILTNPTHFSVAIEYKQDRMSTPVVVAKGQDKIALLIREIARSHSIPIIENPPLARLLYKDVEVNKPIEERHYKAVAEVIAYIMRRRKARMG
jgi:flagellar biosynthetic protein FlhB